ncbi:MAG: hypothetical protein NTZ05_11580, partial [Chloroflexi bacterium]|nr:hypothetical protein [Chloroflexota bacterium]
MPGQPGANGKAAVDWAELERVTRLAVRFLDNVIEINPYPLPQINEMVHNIRRIGLGVMGWSDMLFLLGIPYDSEPAVELANKVMGFITENGHDESEKLAEERGPFPLWDRSIFKDGRPIRNSTVTTIAPTGTISILSGCSSGIEPVFALAFRHIVGKRNLAFVNPVFEQMAKMHGFYSEELMQKVARQGSVKGVAEVPADAQRVFVTAFDVAPEWHVKMQAAFQAHTDNGVSKTINLPNEATRTDVEQAYRMAWDLGCMGITVFRTGSKSEQVLHIGSDDRKSEDGSTPVTAAAPAAATTKPAAVTAATPIPMAALKPARPIIEPPVRQPEPATQMRPRPRRVSGYTYRAETPLGTAFVTVNRNDSDDPMEVFLNVGKAGSDTQAVSEALGRLMSLVLRLPSPLSAREREREIVGQLTGIGGGRAMGFGKARVRSLPDAIAHVLADDLGMTPPAQSLFDIGAADVAHEPVQPVLPGMERHIGDLCPECGHATLVFEEGCQKCYSCGFSEC